MNCPHKCLSLIKSDLAFPMVTMGSSLDVKIKVTLLWRILYEVSTFFFLSELLLKSLSSASVAFMLPSHCPNRWSRLVSVLFQGVFQTERWASQSKYRLLNFILSSLLEVLSVCLPRVGSVGNTFFPSLIESRTWGHTSDQLEPWCAYQFRWNNWYEYETGK